MMKLTALADTKGQAKRVGEVSRVLAKYGLADWIKADAPDWLRQWFTQPDGELLSNYTWEERVRLAMLELGTTYIKLGQMLSARPDLVGPRLADELAKLQSATPADPPEVVRATLEAELKQPVTTLFAEFNFKPLGSASIGQVHQATLPDGTDVVVKVQHAGIIEKTQRDLELMVYLADIAERYGPHLGFQPRALVMEFQRQLRRELDLKYEAHNLNQFIRNFQDDPTVKIPQPYDEWSARRVLTMERLEGYTAHQIAAMAESPLDAKLLATNGANLWIEMIFRDGFFHADPHPGNLLALPDGRIGLLDCGMVGRVDDRTRALMEDLVISLTSKDVEGIVDTLLELCAVPPNFERQAFEVEVNDFLGDYLDLPISQTSFSGMINTMLGAIYRFHIIPPANVIMLLKTISLLEGTGQLLDPDFNLQELMRPHITKIVARRYAPEVILRRLTRSLRSWERLILALPRDLNQTLDKIRQGQLEIKLDIVGLDRTAYRLIYGVVVAALLVGSAIVLTAAVPPTFRDISVFGIVGFVIAFVLSIRLLRAIEKSGKL